LQGIFTGKGTLIEREGGNGTFSGEECEAEKLSGKILLSPRFGECGMGLEKCEREKIVGKFASECPTPAQLTFCLRLLLWGGLRY
jgi:hypothetical protein